MKPENVKIFEVNLLDIIEYAKGREEYTEDEIKTLETEEAIDRARTGCSWGLGSDIDIVYGVIVDEIIRP